MNSNTLTRKQFDVLAAMADASTPLTQRELERQLRHSLGTINRTVKELIDRGYAEKGKITPDGIAALEPYRAKRAVFIAAGFGTRLVPITFNTPKPLVRVRGERIIDGLIDACLAAGIEDVVIVRGYLAEQFDQLLYKYPMIRFLENPAYNDANNIASMMVARYLLSGAYVLDADILLSNPSLIRRYNYSSVYHGIRRARTDDWCVTAKGGFITDGKVGGEGDDCYQMVGISYWSEADGQRLSVDIADVYASPGGKERLWELVPFVYCKQHYKVELRECGDEDIVEIDTFRELKAIDKTYDV